MVKQKINTLIWIIPFVFLFSIIPFISATECFQEFANVSTECGGLDTGNYILSGGTWASGTGTNVIDGDYDTFDQGDDGICGIYINYTIPEGTTGVNWQIKTSGGYKNLSIPELCLNADPTTLILKLESVEAVTLSQYFCFNGTDYDLLNVSSGEVQVYEEAVIWEITISDTTSPIVTINSPTATTYDTLITEINFTASDETSLDICWYSVDGGVTNITTNCNELVTSLTTVDGNSYTWVVGANDTSGNEGSDSVTFDIELPSVLITSPTNITYEALVTDLEYIYTGTPQACWYSLDGGETNVTIVCGENVTDLNSTEGSNTWNVWVNNTLGEVFSDSVIFIITIPEIIDPLESNIIYTSMRGAGAGLGIFINFMGEALPPLVLALAFVGIIVLIGYGIASVFKMNLVKSIRGK